MLKTLPGGERVLRFFAPVDLEALGEMPLPPYIRKRRTTLGQPEHTPEDVERYQTVYAQRVGSVAAPTAGLHFTPELLARFNHAFVTLHVGLGTFRPVKTERLSDHEMHEEVYSIPEGFAEAYEAAERIIAVGTTSARVLESARELRGGGRTRIFIHPPYEFKRVDALLTNFHLPHSTLLMLVSALVGRERAAGALSRGRARTLSLFQLRRRHADPMKSRAAVALTWDGTRFPARRLPAKARAFLGKSTPPAKLAALIAAQNLTELRICWVPRLRGGDDVLTAPFTTKDGKRIPFRLVRALLFGNVLGAVYRRI